MNRRDLILAAPLALLATGATFPSPRGRKHATQSADGVSIVYEEFGRDRGAPTLVLVHGWTCDRSYWAPQIRHFLGAHRVIALDLPGHGESGANRTDWATDNFADDVARVVRAANAERVVLVGHSLGGAVVTLAAPKLDPAPLGIVTVDSMPQIRRSPNGPPPIDAADFRASADAMIRRAMFLPGADPALVDRVARAMSGVNAEHALAIRAAYANYDPGVAYAALGAIPLVMINAALRPTDADGIRGVHPNSRFWIMPNVGHFLMLERPDAFNAILAAELVAFAGQAQPT